MTWSELYFKVLILQKNEIILSSERRQELRPKIGRLLEAVLIIQIRSNKGLIL